MGESPKEGGCGRNINESATMKVPYVVYCRCSSISTKILEQNQATKQWHLSVLSDSCWGLMRASCLLPRSLSLRPCRLLAVFHVHLYTVVSPLSVAIECYIPQSRPAESCAVCPLVSDSWRRDGHREFLECRDSASALPGLVSPTSCLPTHSLVI